MHPISPKGVKALMFCCLTIDARVKGGVTILLTRKIALKGCHLRGCTKVEGRICRCAYYHQRIRGIAEEQERQA